MRSCGKIKDKRAWQATDDSVVHAHWMLGT